MCGISGCLVQNGSAMVSVIDALNKLQNRGYDSAGICTILDNELVIKKYVSGPKESAVSNINSDPLATAKCKIAIGHTRWATHGARTVENAHPHHDDNMRFSLVHNGIIENYLELKEELTNNGYSFYGQTDTEIVVKYLDYLAAQGKGLDYLSKLLVGSWAILVLDNTDPDKIFFMKNGSPLIVGFDKNRSKAMIVSELIGFDADIDQYFVLSDDECGYISLSNNLCTAITTTSYQPIPLIGTITEKSPAPYPYWTLKEINDQPHAISAMLSDRIVDGSINFPELDVIRDELHNTSHLIFLACGTSYHAAQVGSRFFKEFGSNFTIEVIDGADFEEIDIPANKKSVLILLSQSGETKDLYRALQIGRKCDAKTIGIINVENSLIAREVDSVLYLKAGREHAVASTKSFTNQVVMLLLMAIWMNPEMNLILKNKYITALQSLSVDFYQMIKKSTIEIPRILSYFKNQNNCFILGKHSGEWIAKEGSLKIKEISYIHSEGFSAAALKHGPFALLAENVPVILLANDDRFYSKIENATSEIKSRSATVIYITNKVTNQHNVDHIFYFNTDSLLFPLLSIVPLQLLAYYLALDRGNHPDYPRNLAKVVTVE